MRYLSLGEVAGLKGLARPWSPQTSARDSGVIEAERIHQL